jgi:large conductance mechanosensitive channel
MDESKGLSAQAATKRAFSLLDEFKKFALKGNVIDLAVGVIIGAAFAKIVDALVKFLIMPLIAAVLPGEQGYAGWSFYVGSSKVEFGLFLAEVVNFLIVAFALFLFVVKFLGWVMRNRKEEAAAPPPLTKEQELLTEIRDLLKRQPPA